MLPIVQEDTLVEVGKYYMVNHAKMVDRYGESEKTTHYVPIIGIYHKDEQFGVKFPHYHVDGRFISKNKYLPSATIDENGKTNNIVSNDDTIGAWKISEIVNLKVRCFRLTTGINPPDNAVKYWDWYTKQIGKSCAGKRCPHLGTLMHEKDGVLVCPLHNLIGNLETEKIMGGPLGMPPLCRTHYGFPAN